MEATLGGERLGSGNKEKIYGKNYSRSTHRLDRIVRTTAAPGTLIPVYSVLGLPGDTFDMSFDLDINTHPTIGPLYGRFQVQIDTFKIPIRLYVGKLHMNMLGIGMDMKNVKLPQWGFEGWTPNNEINIDNYQINPSSIAAYLGVRGVGISNAPGVEPVVYREFNAIPYLAYVDIYKQYYANKQEEKGCVIHNPLLPNQYTSFEEAYFVRDGGTIPIEYNLTISDVLTEPTTTVGLYPSGKLVLNFTGLTRLKIDTVMVQVDNTFKKATELFQFNEIKNDNVTFTGFIWPNGEPWPMEIGSIYLSDAVSELDDTTPELHFFELDDIDMMRQRILEWVGEPTPWLLNGQMQDIEPYSLIFNSQGTSGRSVWSIQSPQEGLLIKTYNSDLFNNWISTEWLDGDNGVNAITAVQVDEDGKFTIDQLNLQKKLYEVLMRIATKGGSYDDWLEAVYDHERYKAPENPVYIGSLLQEIAFQEVVSNAAAQTNDAKQPLGTLAGKGVLTNKRKGGKMTIRIDEPCYVMSIMSITPLIDYYQGNDWDSNLKTMDDLHKPGLDEIGFQDLITDKMAWFDTKIDPTDNYRVIFKSAGKQPAWIDYQTDYNRVFGNFATSEQSWMVLTRRYEPYLDEQDGIAGIKDLTTYIDPVKFNQVFAYSRLDAQNFMINLGIRNTARRKMSARVIPNL